MNGETRRKNIIARLTEASAPVSASRLAEELGVSRQVIVQDVALLRASGSPVASLARGYVFEAPSRIQRVFKVRHTDEETEQELNLIVDAGGVVADVFVFHKHYGTIRAQMDIRSRYQVQQFMGNISSGKSSLLKNVTSGYHYHTVTADTEEMLDLIRDSLERHGFLAPLQDFEPDGVN
jgi:transcriptional regulator of NAD metabolism